MILFAASLAMLAVIARGLDRMCETPGESRASKLARTLLWAVAAVVVVEAGLGAIGWLGAPATLLALAAIAAGVVVLARRHPRLQAEIREPLSGADVGLVAALIAAIGPRLWAGLHRTTFLYDTLSYHLHVPVRWMHTAHIGIVPAVFGDPSPAYAPSNLELVFLFLMSPLRSDYLAGVGQIPFAALAVAAIVATAREAGGRRSTALAAALAFVLIPEVWGQVPTAMTDLGLAACLLSSLPFALRLWRARMSGRADLLVFAVAIGLAIGSKYAGVALALPFIAIGVIALVRRRKSTNLRRPLAHALVAVLATGGFWYVRNVLVTGNPFYPVAPPGLPLPSLYGGAEMRAWDYHLPVGDLGALGAMLLAAGFGFVGAAAIAIARQWRAVEAVLALALLAAFWFVVPYQESRFLFAAFGAAAIAVARAADRPPTLVGWGGLATAIGGSLVQWPTRERLLVPVVGATAALVFLVARRLRIRIGVFGRRVTVALGLIGLLVGLVAGEARYGRRVRPYTVGDDDLAAAWAWFRANVAYNHVAYTGNNLAFPLAGQHLANRVAYVNVAGAPADRLHDFGPPGDGTAEPAPYRRGATAAAWLGNLRAMDTHVLFVAAMDPIVRRTIAADADGFPLERAWADVRPDVFRLRYASRAARVYAVERP
jgi:4-amino-4-deoxy-L-arabinose transferase-like glycosyltransferase